MAIVILPPYGSILDPLYDVIITLLAFVYVALTIFTPMVLYKKGKVSKFQARKLVHLTAGLAVLVTPFFVWKLWGTIIAGTLSLIVYATSEKARVKKLKELYDTISEEAEEDLKRPYLQGPFHYCAAITLIITIAAIFFPSQIYFAIAGILIMIVSDTLASLFGKKYGKHPINISWTKTTRSVEGSIMLFGSAFILCFSAFLLYGYFDIGTQLHLTFIQVVLYSLLTSVIATLIELISPSTWDDLTIPIATTLTIFLIVWVSSI
jgi:phytol kinase